MKEHTTSPGNLLSIEDVAQILACSTKSVRRLISRGDLPAYRYGPRLIRIDPRDLDKLRQPVTRISEVLGGDAA